MLFFRRGFLHLIYTVNKNIFNMVNLIIRISFNKTKKGNKI